MKVLRDHFDGNATILINDRIINGCQNFTMEEADKILKRYNVPDIIWQQVLDSYTGVSTEEEILAFVEDSDWRVRLAVANQGYGLEKLVDDSNWVVRLIVAEQGYGLEKLVDDPHWKVRRAVANQGYKK